MVPITINININKVGMSIEDLHGNNKISVKAYNLCLYNGFDSIEDLKMFLSQHKSFTKLRTCGTKTNEELKSLCDMSIESNKFPLTEITDEFPLEEIITNLTRTQRGVINSFILINTNQLSVRAKNGIESYLESDFKIKNIGEKILLLKGFQFIKLPNIGKGSVPELDAYIAHIKDFLLEISQSNNEEDLILLKNKFLIQRKYDDLDIPDEILESESIFLITNFLLNQNAFFDKKESTIFKKSLKLSESINTHTREEIAKEFDLTPERVRQILVKILKDLFDTLRFIKNFNEDLFKNYNLDIDTNIIEITTEIVNAINEKSQTDLTKGFIVFILSVYLEDDFSLVGNYSDVFEFKSKNTKSRYIWTNLYLIKKEFAIEINFDALASDISKRLDSRITESYSFNFKSYLSRFLTNNKISILDDALPILEYLINQEFELYLDQYDSLIFERNTKRQVPECVVEALEEIGSPSKLVTLYNWIENKYPGVTKSMEALRASCQREAGIIYFGRSSTFGLKKWEATKDGIKGGTIKDIVIEFLENSSTPIHLLEILDHVLQYRGPTSSQSLLGNLKLDPYKNCMFFKQQFIGLKRKENLYDLKKYNELPVQLGKKIQSLLASNAITNKLEMLNYLSTNYQLTNKESMNILQYLNIEI